MAGFSFYAFVYACGFDIFVGLGANFEFVFVEWVFFSYFLLLRCSSVQCGLWLSRSSTMEFHILMAGIASGRVGSLHLSWGLGQYDYEEWWFWRRIGSKN